MVQSYLTKRSQVCVVEGHTSLAKEIVPSETLQNLYNSLVLSYFDYCSPLWDNCGSMLKEKLQNRAARIMTGANYDVISTDLLHAMSWKNLNDRHKMNKSVLMFKILNNHSAPNLKDKFITRNDKFIISEMLI